MYYIGIDVGTSSVKVILVDETGNIKCTHTKEYNNIYLKTNWIEQDPNIWFDSVIAAIRLIITNIDKKQVAGIGITGQMHTTIILDKDNKVIRPAIMWNDLRTKDVARKLKLILDEYEDIKYLKNIISTGSPASNLYWLKENEPENFAKINKILITKDYIVYRLTGIFATDYCDSSTSALVDLNEKIWSKTMLRILGLSEKVLPQIRSTCEVVGTLNIEIAKLLGLSNNVKVIVGTGDNPATAVVSNIVDDNIPVISLGSSGVVCASCKKPSLNSRAKNILFSIKKQQFNNLVQGVVQATGIAHSWFMEEILQTNKYVQEQSTIDRTELGKNKVIFFPHIAGDKLMFADPSLRGAFLGLGRNTKRHHMVQAVLEGLAFALKDVVNTMKKSGIEISCSKITGGGTKSELWMEIIANVLNMPLKKLNTKEGAAYGIALLTISSCDENSSLEKLVNDNLQIEKTIYPSDELVTLYAEKYKQYNKIYPALKMIYED